MESNSNSLNLWAQATAAEISSNVYLELKRSPWTIMNYQKLS